MGNGQFKVEDIQDAQDRNDLMNRIENIEGTHKRIEETQKALAEKANNLNNSSELREVMSSYLKCLHMGPFRRWVNRSECDKSIEDVVILSFRTVESYKIQDGVSEVSNRIKKLK